MPYALTRDELTTRAIFRLNDARTGDDARWTPGTLEQALTNAIDASAPLGDPKVVTMTGVQYAGTQPVHMVERIRRVQIQPSGGAYESVPGGQVHLNRQAANWLVLDYAPATTSNIRVDLVESYNPKGVRVTADAELLVLLMCAELLERIGLRTGGYAQGEALEANTFRMQAQQRKSELLARLYPEDAPPPSKPRSKR